MNSTLYFNNSSANGLSQERAKINVDLGASTPPINESYYTELTQLTNCPWQLPTYFHSATTAINGTNYYNLEVGTPADGYAITTTSTIGAEQTGRIRPSSNNGKFVYSLTDTTTIPAVIWTLNYRVKRDTADAAGNDSGFV